MHFVCLVGWPETRAAAPGVGRPSYAVTCCGSAFTCFHPMQCCSVDRVMSVSTLLLRVGLVRRTGGVVPQAANGPTFMLLLPVWSMGVDGYFALCSKPVWVGMRSFARFASGRKLWFGSWDSLLFCLGRLHTAEMPPHLGSLLDFSRDAAPSRSTRGIGCLQTTAYSMLSSGKNGGAQFNALSPPENLLRKTLVSLSTCIEKSECGLGLLHFAACQQRLQASSVDGHAPERHMGRRSQ